MDQIRLATQTLPDRLIGIRNNSEIDRITVYMVGQRWISKRIVHRAGPQEKMAEMTVTHRCGCFNRCDRCNRTPTGTIVPAIETLMWIAECRYLVIVGDIRPSWEASSSEAPAEGELRLHRQHLLFLSFPSSNLFFFSFPFFLLLSLCAVFPLQIFFLLRLLFFLDHRLR